DFDGGRDIRFKCDKPLLGQDGANFRLELFHLGHLYKRPVVVNVSRDGIPAPIPYAANLFDYGHTKLGPLPINLGFAGLRLRFPINAPHVWDEVIAFLGQVTSASSAAASATASRRGALRSAPP